MSVVLVVIAFSTAAIVAAYAAYEDHVRAKSLLTQTAAVRSWPFDPSKDDSHDVRYAHFSVFAQGRNRYAFNTIRRVLEVDGEAWPMQLGDYHFEMLEPDENKVKLQAHVLSYVLIETPYLGLPDLLIRSEGVFDRMASALGFDDIHFESADFSNRFVVVSRDKRFAYDVLHPRMMEFLLDVTPPTIDFRRGQCCLSMGERCWTVAEFDAMVRWAAEFFSYWPRHITAAIAE
jgi:hypothetical protein